MGRKIRKIREIIPVIPVFKDVKDERGSIASSTLVLLGIMFFITGSFASILTYEIREATKHKCRIQAYHLAEGAMERAMYQLSQTPDWRTGWSNVSLGAGSYTVTLTTVDNKLLKVTATSTVKDVTRQASIYISQVVPPFKFGVFGTNGVSVNDGKIGAYDSNQGPPPSDFSLAYDDTEDRIYGGATIGTNAITAGAISVSSIGEVKGNAKIGPGGKVNVAISGANRISGTKRASKEEYSMPTPKLPSTYTYIPSITSSTTLIAGTYIIDSISLSGSAILTTIGQVKIYVNNSFSISDTAEMRAGSSLAEDMAVYCRAGVVSATISGNSKFYGVLYAPNADIVLNAPAETNSVIVAGAILGKTVTFTGSKATLYYDKNLKGKETLQVLSDAMDVFIKGAYWQK